jgi:ketosteroid isomerase-like protein
MFKKLSKFIDMSKMSKIKAAIAKALTAKFSNVTTDKGILAWDGDEDLKQGDLVYVEDVEGNRTPAENGDYKTADGKVIKVTDGKVSEIIDAEAEVEPVEEQELASIATDNGELLYEGELEVGTEVFVADAEGKQTPAPEGDYVTEDGKTIKVVDGKVAEIVEETADESTEDAKDDAAEKVETLSKENAELKAQVAELQKQVQELKNKPLAKSAHEELESSVKMQKTGDKGLDKLVSRFAKM